MKREALAQENEDLRSQIEQFQQIYAEFQIEDPIAFKNEMEMTRDELTRLREEMVTKQKMLNAKEDNVLAKEQEIKECKQAIVKEIREIAYWAQREFNVKAITENDDNEDENEHDETAVEDPNQFYIDPILLKEFQKVKQQLLNQKTNLQQKFFKQKQR